MNKIFPIITQNIDIISTRKNFEACGELIAVTSMFVTIQGEGPYAGYPAVFLRTAGCNFGDKKDHCSWCDTNFVLDEATWYSPEDLRLALINLFGYNSSQILVITGGEPTLQHNLLLLINKVTQDFSEIQIETNGTQPAFYKRAELLQLSNSFKSVVSPKASVKANRYTELSKDVMWWASCLKFVVCTDTSSPHHTIPSWALLSHKPVYVSPMAVYLKPYKGEVSSIWDTSLINSEATKDNYAYAAQYALQNNLRLSLQTHLFTSIP